MGDPCVQVRVSKFKESEFPIESDSMSLGGEHNPPESLLFRLLDQGFHDGSAIPLSASAGKHSHASDVRQIFTFASRPPDATN